MGELIEIQTASDLRHRHGPGHRLERAAKAGELIRLRPGAYASTTAVEAAPPDAIHRARVVASRLAAHREPVFSHESAAALHGIPLIGSWPTRARTTVRTRTNSSAAVERTLRILDDADIMTLPDGVRTTSPARTAIDLAASRSLLAGIIAISHVRASGVGLDEFDAVIARAGRFHGLRRARIALARSCGGSRSVLETLVIVRCQDTGFEVPAQRHAVTGIDGVTYQVDFSWSRGLVLGEIDARDAHPDRAPRDGPDLAEAAWAARRREDALRPVCAAFVRIGWVEAWGGVGLTRRLAAAGVPRSEVRRIGLTT